MIKIENWQAAVAAGTTLSSYGDWVSQENEKAYQDFPEFNTEVTVYCKQRIERSLRVKASSEIDACAIAWEEFSNLNALELENYSTQTDMTGEVTVIDASGNKQTFSIEDLESL